MITNLNHAEIGGTRKMVPWKIAPPGDCLNPNPNPKPNPNPGRKMLGAIFREATFWGAIFRSLESVPYYKLFYQQSVIYLTQNS